MVHLLTLSIVTLFVIYSSPIIRASPVPGGAAGSHPFDLGLLNSCVQPTVQQLADCHQYIDYPVPSVLLSERLLNIKHRRINAVRNTAHHNEMTAGNSSLAETCAQTALEHKCKEEFPPCYTMQDTHKMVGLSPPDPCLASTSTNPCTYYEPSCGTTPSNVSLTTCHLTSQLNDYNYTYCNTLSDWSSIYITKWMHTFLQKVEQQVSEFSSALSSDAARRVCVPMYVELQCGTVGRCSEQGTRAEMNATREVCESLMNCVGSNLRTSLSNFINCSHYPSVNDKPPTMATPITPPTAPPTNTSATTTRPPTVRPPTSGITQEPTVFFPDVPDRVTTSSSDHTTVPYTILTVLLITTILVLLH